MAKVLLQGAGITCWLECQTCDRKVASLNPSGAVGEFIFQSLTSNLCADSYSVSVPSPCYCSGMEKTTVILPKEQVAGYT